MSDTPAIRYGLDQRPGRPQPERYVRHGLSTATAPAILPAKVPAPEVTRPPSPETRQAIADRLDSSHID